MMRGTTRILTFLFASALVFSASCKRNKDCDVMISVVDLTSKAPLVGASVHLYPDPALNPTLTIQDQSGTTDASGVASFTFKLPAILKCDVVAPAPFTGTATKLVKLEEGKKVSVTIPVP